MNSKGKQKKRKIRSDGSKCLFCFKNDRDILKYGKTYKYNDIYAHHNCLLFASGLAQNGADNEGIEGFLEGDIRKELRRAEKLKCCFNGCKASGASIGCVVTTCKKMFHLPCGQKNKALNQFFGKYDTYCVTHRPKQTLEASHEYNDACPICYINVEFDEGIEVLATPCCSKLCHRICLQKQALSAGYFFKCPLCNNVQKFIETMNTFGINIPKEDASWERETNAFSELYQRHSRCDRQICLCPESREYRNENNWQLLICNTCGSKGTHWKCIGRSDWVEAWVCNECELVEERVQNLSNDKNEVHSDDDSESDIEIISTSFDNSVHPNEYKIKISNIKLSNDSNQMFEINVSDESQENKVKRLKKPEMKDVAIQCTLVDAKDLVDSEPIDELDPYDYKKSIVSLPNISKKEEIIDLIDIDDSDEELVVLN